MIYAICYILSLSYQNGVSMANNDGKCIRNKKFEGVEILDCLFICKIFSID